MVALTVSTEHRDFLRGIFEAARGGICDELAEYPDQLREPRQLHREEAVYDALLAALDSGSIVAAADICQVLSDLAKIIDDDNEYERIVIEHHALYGLLGQIEAEGSR
jgi:hypothetical protein